MQYNVPNFLFIGLPKSGSTTIHFILRQHPDVCLPQDKEAHFFDNTQHYELGLPCYAEKHFSHYAGERFIGDITPVYFTDPAYIRRIQALMGPDIKIIVCYRFPVARMFSHYIHDAFLFEHNDTLDEMLDRDPDCSQVRASRYIDNTKILYEAFPEENILPLIFERDFAAEGSHVAYQKIKDFLGLPDHPGIVTNMAENKSYVARASIATESNVISSYYYGKTFNIEYNPGDIVVEYLNETKFYSVKIIPNPSENDFLWWKKYSESITRTLSQEDIMRYYQRFFAEDVEHMKIRLKDAIPEWGPTTCRVGSYKLIASKLPNLIGFDEAKYKDISRLRHTAA